MGTRLRWAAGGALAGALAIALSASDLPIRSRSREVAGRPRRPAIPLGKRVNIAPPLGLPPVSIPDDNPPTEETIALGRRLFFDPILSRDGKMSCATCHDPKTALSDARQFSDGFRGAKGTRNAMAVVNAAFNFSQFWDGRAESLEQQAEGPVQNPIEMAHTLVGVERKLAANPKYAARFAEAWGPGAITYEMVAKSLASYERTLLSGNSPFDRYFYGGDKSAMSESAVRGLELFQNILLDAPNCVSCHRIEPKYATFTEVRFHNTGVAWNLDRQAFTDNGHYEVSRMEKDRGAFKVPTLRNIALTAPYMHNGSMKTLEEVVDFYFDGGRPNPRLSGVMPHHGMPAIPKEQQPQAKKDLVEFMKALTGEIPAGATPPPPD
jgi:cytochrome c peroxidase